MNNKLTSPYERRKITIHIPTELHRQLHCIAQQENTTVTTLINQTLVKMIVNEYYIKGKYPHFT